MRCNMVDMQSISLAIQSAKSITDIVKALSEGGKKIEINQIIIDLQSKVLSLQSHLLSAQQEQSELIKIKEQIEKELVQHKDWNVEKDKYEPIKTQTSTIVYRIKSPKNDIEKEICFCPKCMNDRKASMLQPEGNHAYCPECGNKYRIRNQDGPVFCGGVSHD